MTHLVLAVSLYVWRDARIKNLIVHLIYDTGMSIPLIKAVRFLEASLYCMHRPQQFSLKYVAAPIEMKVLHFSAIFCSPLRSSGVGYFKCVCPKLQIRLSALFKVDNKIMADFVPQVRNNNDLHFHLLTHVIHEGQRNFLVFSHRSYIFTANKQNPFLHFKYDALKGSSSVQVDNKVYEHSVGVNEASCFLINVLFAVALVSHCMQSYESTSGSQDRTA